MQMFSGCWWESWFSRFIIQPIVVLHRIFKDEHWHNLRAGLAALSKSLSQFMCYVFDVCCTFLQCLSFVFLLHVCLGAYCIWGDDWLLPRVLSENANENHEYPPSKDIYHAKQLLSKGTNSSLKGKGIQVMRHSWSRRLHSVFVRSNHNNGKLFSSASVSLRYLPSIFCKLFVSEMHKPLIWSPLPQKEISGEMCNKSIPIYHQLCVAYCLRALCTQEAKPRSQVLKHADNFHCH